MHILLTRPLEDSQEMILKLKSLGHDISHIPLIEIKKKNMKQLILKIIRQLFLLVLTQ